MGMIKQLKNIFFPKKFHSFSNRLMNEIIDKNRNTLKKIQTWIDNEAFSNSFYKYGVPDSLITILDLEIDREITYSDLILYYSKFLDKVNYLELGVSVGKNFFQISNALENSFLTGFDIENINPVLHKNYSYLYSRSWNGKPDSIRTEKSTLTTYKFNGNLINYLAGDIWDENSWIMLRGNKYNIIFSDALHTPDALLWEYEMIEKYQLLDSKFIMLWDDLNNGLEKSFYKITEKIINLNKLENFEIRIIKINGWLGNNYPIKHDVGLITNIKI